MRSISNKIDDITQISKRDMVILLVCNVSNILLSFLNIIYGNFLIYKIRIKVRYNKQLLIFLTPVIFNLQLISIFKTRKNITLLNYYIILVLFCLKEILSIKLLNFVFYLELFTYYQIISYIYLLQFCKFDFYIILL